MKLRKGYFFGYGADQEEDMIMAITGKKPKIVGKAILQNYELRIQKLSEITTAGDNPRKILNKVWGDSFKSYALVARPGSQVSGIVFRLSLKARNMVDKWELTNMGWYDKKFVTVTMLGTGKRLKAETQVLNPSQQARTIAKPGRKPWLMAKKKFLAIAIRNRNNKPTDSRKVR